MGEHRNGRLANVLGLVYLVVIIVVARGGDPADADHERGHRMSDACSTSAKQILDHQLLDWDGRRCGNVDDLELERRPGRAARRGRGPRRGRASCGADCRGRGARSRGCSSACSVPA